MWRGDFLGGDTQIYGWDLEASQYFHGPLDTILLFNGEVAGVDTWDHPETDHIQDLTGTPLLMFPLSRSLIGFFWAVRTICAGSITAT